MGTDDAKIITNISLFFSPSNMPGRNGAQFYLINWDTILEDFFFCSFVIIKLITEQLIIIEDAVCLFLQFPQQIKVGAGKRSSKEIIGNSQIGKIEFLLVSILQKNKHI